MTAALDAKGEVTVVAVVGVLPDVGVTEGMLLDPWTMIWSVLIEGRILSSEELRDPIDGRCGNEAAAVVAAAAIGGSEAAVNCSGAVVGFEEGSFE